MNKPAIVGSVILFFALLILLAAGGWAWRYYTAEVRGVVSAEEQIESAPSRIANYNHFFDLCASVQSKEDKITAQERVLATTEDADAKDRVRQNIASLEGRRAADIRRYNADASKQYTQARFKASSLPYRLDVNAERTVCNTN